MDCSTRLVLVTDYDFPTGGIEQFLFQLVKRLDTRFDCRVLTWSREVLVPTSADVICIEHGDIRTVWSVLETADVVLVVTSFNIRLLARLVIDCMAELQKPMIVVVQTSGHSDPSASVAKVQLDWFNRLLAASNVIVAVSDDVKTAIGATSISANIFPPVVVIENAARLRADGPRRRRARKVVGFIGRPQPQKGFSLFERLAQESSSRGLLFVANTVSLPAPRLVPEIRFSHNCTDAELIEFFSSLDVLVAPYLRADGLPLALQEALNCGVPVIGFDSPGVGIILRRHDQVVIEPTYEALKAAVLAWQQGTLAVHPPMYGSVANWDVQSLQYAKLIESVVMKRPFQDHV